MGWCSGTDVFDGVLEHFLTKKGVKKEPDVESVIKGLIQALWDHDWDCEQDSAYWEHPLVQKVFRKLDPRMFEENEDD